MPNFGKQSHRCMKREASLSTEHKVPQVERWQHGPAREMRMLSALMLSGMFAGFRMMSTSVLAAFLPDYSQQAFMHQPTVFAAESTVLGFCGFLSAILIGMLCERLFVRMPAVSLYTSCIGALAASVFMALTLFATLLLRTSNARYGVDTAPVESLKFGFRSRATVNMPCLLPA